MLEIKGLKKAFGSLEVLKGVDLKVNQGDVVAILGPSGSGKNNHAALCQLSGACGRRQPDF